MDGQQKIACVAVPHRFFAFALYTKPMLSRVVFAEENAITYVRLGAVWRSSPVGRMWCLRMKPSSPLLLPASMGPSVVEHLAAVCRCQVVAVVMVL